MIINESDNILKIVYGHDLLDFKENNNNSIFGQS